MRNLPVAGAHVTGVDGQMHGIFDWVGDAIGTVVGTVGGLVTSITKPVFGAVGGVIGSVMGSVKPVVQAATGLVCNSGVQRAAGIASVIPGAGMAVGTAVGAVGGLLCPQAVPGGAAGSATVGPTSTGQPYPTGTVARWHEKEMLWWIYKPRALNGHLYGAFAEAFGASEPAVPDEKIPGTEALTPAGAAKGENIKPAIYEQPWFWAAAGGGVLLLGTLTYLAVRK